METFCLPLIKLEIELDLLCSKDFVISEISRTPELPANPAGNANSTIFQINSTNVALSINDNIKFVENIKHGFKRTVSWNK